MKDLIEQIEPLAQKLRDLESPSPYIGNAISALCAAQSNLKWELEAQTAKEKKAAAAVQPAKK